MVKTGQIHEIHEKVVKFMKNHEKWVEKVVIFWKSALKTAPYAGGRFQM